MTTSTATELARRTSKVEPTTFAGGIALAILDELDASKRITWPSTRYQRDPAAFFREILGVEPWSKQLELIEAVRDHKRVSVRSGHKVSKSHTAAGLALWFYCSFPRSRVVLTSTTNHQIDDILWRELRMMLARAGICVDCRRHNEAHPHEPHLHIQRPCSHSAIIPEAAAEHARTGLKSDDFREITGHTAKEAEAIAGISGEHLFYVIDEASGVAQAIFEAIEGNRAGGARVLMLSNPTRNEGEHYESFYGKKEFYRTITISSEETPNAMSGEVIIPGLCERAFILEKQREWGPDSPLYKIRIKGEHALNEDGRIFSIHAIEEAEKRWIDATANGRLYVGLDPAGESGSGDETAFCVRRGSKALKITTFRGLNDEGHLVELLVILAEFAEPKEIPVVVIDSEGSVGSSLAGRIRSFLNERKNRGRFEFVAVKASAKSMRQGELYERNRDALAGNLQAWFRAGGAIPEIPQLAADLHCLNWKQQVGGKIKLTSKDEIRKMLGRSPDRYDALALSCWEPVYLREDTSDDEEDADFEDDEDYGSGLDPYAGGMDPYASAFR